ncbi:hypothetical protein BK816_03355 [Boudabousia tangfeifanii]|uniref:Glycosyl transferase family 28 C-terminal domain-containing protein n=1 Tax=Boudabousia tangfeifanii TaxID=1912795 RepID=A0A1D9MJG6_9ACTO|nr:glycosyltransferase [Boudabousia tangfeifanii]AOZ72447.1 hypothetical protein BK816_03355 [Boudabousia tangfeifanii]
MTENVLQLIARKSEYDQLVVFMVGTHHLAFDRFIGYAEAYSTEHPNSLVLIQYGSSRAPRAGHGFAFFTKEESKILSQKADLLVAHGGPSIMMEWAREGHYPVCVPRNPKLGEHIDEHQMVFCEMMQNRGLTITAHNEEELKIAIQHVLADQMPRSERARRCNQLLPPVTISASRVGELANALIQAGRDRLRQTKS